MTDLLNLSCFSGEQRWGGGGRGWKDVRVGTGSCAKVWGGAFWGSVTLRSCLAVIFSFLFFFFLFLFQMKA